jgi:acyl-CoA thioester hydrolase
MRTTQRAGPSAGVARRSRYTRRAPAFAGTVRTRADGREGLGIANDCKRKAERGMSAADGAARAAAAGATAACAGSPAPFVWRVRVYYEDTDSGGVVYYANYLRFFERCRTEWMRSLGFGQRELSEREGVVFVVAHAEIAYRRSARLDDELTIDARIAERYASYVVFEQQAWRGTELLSEARVKVACVDVQSMRPARLPPALAACLSGLPDRAAQPTNLSKPTI